MGYKSELNDILNNPNRNYNDAAKILELMGQLNPNLDKNFQYAVNQTSYGNQKALQNFYERNLPGFNYKDNGTGIVPQADGYIQGIGIDVSIGLSVSIAGHGVSFGINSLDMFYGGTYQSIGELACISFDVMYGSGKTEVIVAVPGTKMSIGSFSNDGCSSPANVS
jgi:hypothetical protein